MFVWAVLFATTSFIPCHTVTLGNEASLALDRWGGGTPGTGKSFGYSITIRLQTFTVKVSPDGRNKELVVLLF